MARRTERGAGRTRSRPGPRWIKLRAAESPRGERADGDGRRGEREPDRPCKDGLGEHRHDERRARGEKRCDTPRGIAMQPASKDEDEHEEAGAAESGADHAEQRAEGERVLGVELRARRRELPTTPPAMTPNAKASPASKTRTQHPSSSIPGFGGATSRHDSPGVDQPMDRDHDASHSAHMPGRAFDRDYYRRFYEDEGRASTRTTMSIGSVPSSSPTSTASRST